MACIDVTLLPYQGQPLLVVVAAAVIDADGRVLLAERPAGKEMAGLWEFPGGKVQPGETPEMALCRELSEELDIATTPGCLYPAAFTSYTYETFHLLMPLFFCRVWEGQVTPREGQRIVWARVGELDRYAMPPADVPLVSALRQLL